MDWIWVVKVKSQEDLKVLCLKNWIKRNGEHYRGSRLGMESSQLYSSFRDFTIEKSIRHPSVAIKEAIIHKCGIQKRV